MKRKSTKNSGKKFEKYGIFPWGLEKSVKEGMHIRDYPFRIAQSAIQFYVSDGAPDWESLEEFMSE